MWHSLLSAEKIRGGAGLEAPRPEGAGSKGFNGFSGQNKTR
jgi:hypothetical protein